MSHFHQNFIAIVINLYGLELDDHQVDTLVVSWLQKYDRNWIIKAIVESLYRGRYKIVSVDNILRDWQRLGRPRYNFTPEYEREILQNLPAVVELPAASDSPEQMSLEESEQVDVPVVPPALQDTKLLNPEESAPFQYHHHPIPAPPTNPQALELSASEEHQLKLANIPESIESSPDIDAHPNGSLASSSATERDKEEIATASEEQIEPAKIGSQPTKRKLFYTLKAIVDPNNHHYAAASNCALLQSLSVEIADRMPVDRFKLPLENQNEQHQL